MSGPSGGGEGGGQQIHVVVRRPWGAAPLDILEEGGISPTARLVLVYLLVLSARPRWEIRVGHVQGALGLTQGAWQRARKELEHAGYYKIARLRGSDGRLHWEHEVRDEPDKSIGHKSTDGGAIDGKQTDIYIHRDLRARKQQHARARVRGPAVPARAAAGQSHESQAQPTRRRGELIAGVEVWTDADREAATKLLETHGVPAVRAAADAVRAGGQDPLPSRVSAAISKQQRAVRAGEAEAAAAARTARIEELGRIDADERLGLITADEAAVRRRAVP